jgi:ABC-type sugar transport system ATPase subunit
LFEILTQKEIQFIFSTQVKEEIIFVCDTCIVIEKGKIIGQFQQPFLKLNELYKKELLPISLTKYSEINLLTLNEFQIYPNEGVLNYNLRAGEIVGVFSEDENSARDLLLCCAGLQVAEQGELLLNGFDLFGRPLEEFINDGVVYIAEDHLEGNLIPDMPLFEHYGLMGDFTELIFQPQKYKSEATRQLLTLGIKQEWDTPVKNLSKKDQIKFLFNILPKTLSLLICINPTGGLDRETKQWVWQEIQQRAKSGIGILVFSNEKEELQQNTHTIWLNKEGKWLESFESRLLLEKYNQPLVLLDEENHADN